MIRECRSRWLRAPAITKRPTPFDRCGAPGVCVQRFSLGRSLSRIRPRKVRAQTFMDRTAVIWLWDASGRIVEGMIGRGQARRIVTHQVRYDSPNTALFVIEHDRCATGGTGAKFQGTVRVLIIERLTVQAIIVIDVQIPVLEKHYVGRRLTGNSLADGAVTSVVVDWFFV